MPFNCAYNSRKSCVRPSSFTSPCICSIYVTSFTHTETSTQLERDSLNIHVDFLLFAISPALFSIPYLQLGIRCFMLLLLVCFFLLALVSVFMSCVQRLCVDAYRHGFLFFCICLCDSTFLSSSVIIFFITLESILFSLSHAI